MLHAQGELPAEIHIKKCKIRGGMSLDILNVVNVVLTLSMAKRLLLREPHHRSCPYGW